MKRLSLYLFLIFFTLQTPSYTADVIKMLFGVKLNEDVSKYARIENGKKSEFMLDIIDFNNEDITLDRNSEFDRYLLRTNKNYQVINLGARRKNNLVPFDNFKNQCLTDRNRIVSDISNTLNIEKNEFKDNYRKTFLDLDKPVNERKVKYLWHDTTYLYEDDGQKFRLMIYCGYLNDLNENKKLLSFLYLSWITEDYYRKYVLPRFEIIEPFDNNFIKKFLKN